MLAVDHKPCVGRWSSFGGRACWGSYNARPFTQHYYTYSGDSDEGCFELFSADIVVKNCYSWSFEFQITCITLSWDFILHWAYMDGTSLLKSILFKAPWYLSDTQPVLKRVPIVNKHIVGIVLCGYFWTKASPSLNLEMKHRNTELDCNQKKMAELFTVVGLHFWP